MGFKETIEKYGMKATDEMVKSMQILENHMITIQGNQLEQEAYDKQILERLKAIEKVLKK
jgi:hypothetical protein